MQSIQRRALTPLALAILALLHEHPMHPYEIGQVIQERRMDRILKVRAGSLYHTVERLNHLGLIETVETCRTGRRPERTVYAITGEGREDFRDGLRTALRTVVTEYPTFGAAIEMLRMLPPAEAGALLERRAVELETVLAAIEQVSASMTRRGLPRINLVEVEYAAAMHRAELGWVSTLRDDIRSGGLTWQPCQPWQPEPHLTR